MESLGAIMMITALAWPIIGGGLVGLIGGIVKGHGLVGTLVDAILGAIAGYALVMAFMVLSQKVTVPESALLPLSLGLPVLGGLIGLWIKGRVRPA